MKKYLPFVKSVALTFVLYFAFSLIFNHLLHENESIGRTLFSSLMFAVIYHFLTHLLSKAKKDKEN